MHELSLAQGLLDQLAGLAVEHGASRIVTVHVDIGTDAGIVVDSFSFGFDAIKGSDKLTANAVLAINRTAGPDLILTRVEME